MLMIVVFALASLPGLLAQPTFPNIQFIGQSYDLLRGNPFSQNYDPGFTGQLVINQTYLKHYTTPDKRYSIPDCTSGEVVKACTYQATSVTMKSMSDYSQAARDSAAFSVGVDTPWAGFAFSMSSDYSTAERQIVDNQWTDFSAKTFCEYYQLTLQGDPSITPYTPTDEFANSVNNFPTTYSADSVRSFLQTYGTHFLRVAYMGGRWREDNWLSSSDVQTLQYQGIDIATEASYHIFWASGSVSSETEQQEQQRTAFQNTQQSTTRSFIGGDPPMNGNQTAWLESVGANPYPVTYTLEPLTTLFNKYNFPKDSQIVAKQKVMQWALDCYMQSWRPSECSTPPPSPPPSPPAPTPPTPPTGCLANTEWYRHDCSYGCETCTRRTFPTKSCIKQIGGGSINVCCGLLNVLVEQYMSLDCTGNYTLARYLNNQCYEDTDTGAFFYDSCTN
eukprot:TRINITY_DN56_c0_g1_i1.p1 TRINITY_DN56_c0_g1~~TRINITY_DN56_c0_g1_i1.p1  ORF type:complete len:447 (+),score=63.99 TRINITY_DN56_c0_g1_i1:1116-2456(+)